MYGIQNLLAVINSNNTGTFTEIIIIISRRVAGQAGLGFKIGSCIHQHIMSIIIAAKFKVGVDRVLS